MTQYGYAGNKEELLTRLARAEGQVRGVARMVDADKYCIDILTQISAIQGALDQVALELLREHTHHCLTNDTIDHGTQQEKSDELVAAVGRLLRAK